jgi:hypothetical protein
MPKFVPVEEKDTRYLAVAEIDQKVVPYVVERED